MISFDPKKFAQPDRAHIWSIIVSPSGVFNITVPDAALDLLTAREGGGMVACMVRASKASKHADVESESMSGMLK